MVKVLATVIFAALTAFLIVKSVQLYRKYPSGTYYYGLPNYLFSSSESQRKIARKGFALQLLLVFAWIASFGIWLVVKNN